MSDLKREEVEKDAKLRAILQAVPEEIYLFDVNGICSEVLASPEDAVYSDIEELPGKPVEEIFDFVEVDELKKQIREVVADSGSFIGYFTGAYPSERSYEVRVASSEGSNQAVVFARDITERVLAEKAAEELETRYYFLIENTSDAVAVVTGDEIIYASEAACGLTGFSIDELYSKTVWEIVRRDDHYRASRYLNLIRTGRKFKRAANLSFWSKKGEVLQGRVKAKKIRYKGLDSVMILIENVTKIDSLDEKFNTDFYRRMIDDMHDVFIATDAEGKITTVNLSGLKKLGYASYDEIVGLETKYVLLDAGADKILSDKLCEKGFVRDYAVSLLRKDGTKFETVANVRLIKDSDGTVSGSEAIFRDISTEIKYRKAARESEETYRNIFHNAQVGLFRTRIADGMILEANDALADMFGYSDREDIIDQYVTSENYVDSKARGRLLDSLSSNGDVSGFEAEFYKKDGSTFWARFTAKIFPDKGWIQGVAEDVTAIQKARSEILDRARFQSALAAIRGADPTRGESGLWKTFLSTIVQEYELEAAWQGNYRDGKIAPLTYEGNLSEEMKKVVIDIKEALKIEKFCAVADALTNGRPAVCENLAEKKFVGPHCKEALKNGLRSNLALPYKLEGKVEGGVMLFSKIVDDFTPEKIERLELLVFEIERLITDRRSKSKSDRELAAAAVKLREADRYKNRFLANMSHELRTPLNPILGFTEILLAESDLDDDAREMLLSVKNSSKSLLSLINDILDMSQLEFGGMNLNLDKFGIDEIARELEEEFADRTKQSGFRFKVEIGDEIPDYVRGDKSKIKQSLRHLLTNALKFSDKPGSTIGLKIERTPRQKIETKIESPDDGKLYASFLVEDEGSGINPEQINDIFKSFVQGDSSSTRKRGGAGIGLSIVDRLAKLMGGVATVQSKFGSGSEFEIILPLETTSAPQTKKSDSLKSSDLKTADRKTKLLVAEDDITNIILYRTYFKSRKGFETVFAKNGKEAIELAEKNGFDAILMDLKMPLVDGKQASKIIRKYERDANLKRTPIIGVTADVAGGRRDELLAAGMDEVIYKPITPSDLSKIVEKYFK